MPLRDFESGVFCVAKLDGMATLRRLQRNQQTCGERALSDGGCSGGGGIASEERLRYAGGPEGRLFNDGSPSVSKEALSVSVSENQGMVSEDNGLLRHLRGTELLHQDTPPNHPYFEVSGFDASYT